MLSERISEKLGLTEGTVKWYLQQVFDKLGVRDRTRSQQDQDRFGKLLANRASDEHYSRQDGAATPTYLVNRDACEAARRRHCWAAGSADR
jgi:hypothetical protein